ncbi:MAG: hypothetical protein JSS66_13245 [Armatimonadetes bacterium]|nr:hypothetical protein [Armatimonadota bacterium]
MQTLRNIALTALTGGLLVWAVAVTLPPRQASAKPVEVRTAIAEVAVREDSIPIEGKFTANSEDIVLVGLASPNKLKALLVKPGDHVLLGQALARIDVGVAPLPVRHVTKQSEAVHAEALSNALGGALEAHQAAMQAATRELEAAKADRDKALAQAKAEMDKALAAPVDGLAKAQGAVDDARNARDKAKAKAEKEQYGYEQGWIARNEATAAKEAAQRAEDCLTAAERVLQDAQKAASESNAGNAKAAYQKAAEAAENKVKAALTKLNSLQSGGPDFQTAAPLVADLSSPMVFGRITGAGQLRSPAAGTVVKTTSKALVAILKDGAPFMLVGTVPADKAAVLRAGMVARLANGSTGTIVEVGVADPATKVCKVRVSCQPVAELEKAGQAVVPLASSSRSIQVPSSAVTNLDGHTVVFVVTEGRAVARPVTVRAGSASSLEVVAGLARGDEVILSPEGIRDGQAVLVSH